MSVCVRARARVCVCACVRVGEKSCFENSVCETQTPKRTHTHLSSDPTQLRHAHLAVKNHGLARLGNDEPVTRDCTHLRLHQRLVAGGTVGRKQGRLV